MVSNIVEYLFCKHIIIDSNNLIVCILKTDSPSAGRPKPRSVRRRLANPPPQEAPGDEDSVSSKNMIRSESMEKASGEGVRRMCRRTASWQPKPSNNVLDFDEVAARVDALTRN